MKQSLLLVVLLSLALPLQRTSAQSCMSADTLSADILAEVTALTTTSDSLLRTALQVPATTSSQISLVTDELVCARAWQALDSTVKATNPAALADAPPRRLYVVTVGSFRAVVDPDARVGEWFPMYFFDAAWTYVNMLLGWK